MYEAVTFEKLLTVMLNQTPADLDKREGSVLYSALAPPAVEMQNLYIALDTVLNETFADTASRESLIKRCNERGITPKPSARAVAKAVFNMNVPIGSRFSLEDYNYTVIVQLGAGVYQAECETAGSSPNAYLGRLIPIEYIRGLNSAELVEILIPGEDEEETESLRRRYFASLDAEAFGGNVADYKAKVHALSGVGGVKVYPVWNGGGTVKLTVINSDFHAPSTLLVDRVQTVIDPIQNRGEGLGLAPIGHTVMVEGVKETAVNVRTVLTYQDGWTWADVEPYAAEVLEEYFSELRKNWENTGTDKGIIVRIAQIDSLLLDLPGVVDVSSTTLNENTQNLTLSSDEIPIRGTLHG